jgi:hypothetical protein
MGAENLQFKDFGMARSRQNDPAWNVKGIIAEVRMLSSQRLSQPMPLLRAVVDDQLVNDNYEEGRRLCMTFVAMENRPGGWRSRMNLPMLDPAGCVRPTAAVAEIVSALSLLQHAARRDAMPAVRSLKSHLQQQFRKVRPDKEIRPLARREEDLIDMVSMLFEFVLDDCNLPDSARTLIARLQIPVIKVALLETSLFRHRNHSVWRLLDALVQAGSGLDKAGDAAHARVFRKVESTVHRVLDGFDRNLNLFEELLNEFTAFMQKEDHRSRIAEERIRQVAQNKEQMQLAKRKVAYEIVRRLHGKPTPVPVRSFLLNTWKDVLILGYLRRDKSGDWEHSLKVMDELLWSVTVPLEAGSHMDLLNIMPPLVKSIKAGLEALSLDPRGVAMALDDLAACHVMRLPQPLAGAEGAIGRTGLLDKQAPRKVEVQDPELVRAIVEIRADLPEVDHFDVGDLIQLPSGFDVAHEERGEAFDAADDAIAKARHLAVGEWVEFDDGNRRVRAKLAWKSQLTSNCVFVNRRGGKVAEITLPELARRLSEGAARILVKPAASPIDRAFNALLDTPRARLKQMPYLMPFDQ